MRALILCLAIGLSACAVARPPEQPKVMRLAPEFKPTGALARRGTISVAAVTSGGIIGVVTSVKDRTVSLRSADAKMEVTKSSVTEILEGGNAVES